MKTLANILYRLARFLAGMPPEELGAMVLIALESSELLAALFAPELFVALFALVLFVLKYVAVIIIGEIVAWYLTSICKIHLWPKLSSENQRVLLKLQDLILLKKTDRPTNRDGVGCAPVGSRRKLYDKIVSGRSDANIPFEQIRNLLLRLGFEERVRGSHHIFTRENIEELIDIQEVSSECKPYQVKQVRTVLTKYNLRKEL
jgi:hypothetical protein